MLRVDNPNGRLQQHTQLRWRDICIAPCGVNAGSDGDSTASAAARRWRRNRSACRARRGDVFIDAEVGSKVKHWVGLGLMIGGVVAAGYGFAFWQFFNSFAANDMTSTAQDARSFGRTVGIVFLSVGAVLEAVGLPMFFSGTSVQVR